jgi:hypothetical protein
MNAKQPAKPSFEDDQGSIYLPISLAPAAVAPAAVAREGHAVKSQSRFYGLFPWMHKSFRRKHRVFFGSLWAVTALAGSGTIRRIDTDAALRLPGVRSVMTHENAPRLRKVVSLSMSEPGVILPLQSPRIAYAGQVVAVVVADTLTAARQGVAAVTFEIEPGPAPVVGLEDADARLRAVRRAGIGPGRSRKGDADAALAAASVTTDDTFHNAPHRLWHKLA